MLLCEDKVAVSIREAGNKKGKIVLFVKLCYSVCHDLCVILS